VSILFWSTNTSTNAPSLISSDDALQTVKAHAFPLVWLADWLFAAVRLITPMMPLNEHLTAPKLRASSRLCVRKPEQIIETYHGTEQLTSARVSMKKNCSF
jgi:hypothetical protein